MRGAAVFLGRDEGDDAPVVGVGNVEAERIVLDAVGVVGDDATTHVDVFDRDHPGRRVRPAADAVRAGASGFG